MRTLFLASAAIATVLSGLSGAPAFAQYRPGAQGAPGAQAAPGGGQQAPRGGQPAGSYTQSCRNIQANNGVVTAECLNIHSQYQVSSIPYTACHGDLSNQNGLLSCAGAAASGGAVVSNGNDRRNNNNNNNGSVAAGVAAGAVLGGLLAGGGNVQLYTPGYAYPAYGDQHYGDPRYDPRYSQQGWGAGHRPGEWVWIHDRADWLSRQINRATEDGALSRRDARDLQNQLGDLENRENTYRRQGLSNRMRADLDRRFDQLAAQVQDAERRHGDHRDNRDNGRDYNGDRR